MSFVSNLTLALSTFTDMEVHAIGISKEHSENYHVYYRKNGKNRVMIVPKKECDIEQLQFEVGVLLSRNEEEQVRLGTKDGAYV